MVYWCFCLSLLSFVVDCLTCLLLLVAFVLCTFLIVFVCLWVFGLRVFGICCLVWCFGWFRLGICDFVRVGMYLRIKRLRFWLVCRWCLLWLFGLLFCYLRLMLVFCYGDVLLVVYFDVDLDLLVSVVNLFVWLYWLSDLGFRLVLSFSVCWLILLCFT